jgi:hypothetical protein
LFRRDISDLFQLPVYGEGLHGLGWLKERKGKNTILETMDGMTATRMRSSLDTTESSVDPTASTAPPLGLSRRRDPVGEG